MGINELRRTSLESHTDISGTQCMQRLRAAHIGPDRIDDYGRILTSERIYIQVTYGDITERYRIEQFNNVFIRLVRPDGTTYDPGLMSRYFDPSTTLVEISREEFERNSR